MSLRTPYFVRVLYDLVVCVLAIGLLVSVGLAIASHFSSAMSERFKPFHGIVCRTLDPKPAATNTRAADLTGDWQGLGAKSVASAGIDALVNEAWAFCRGGGDSAHEAFLNLADKTARKARKVLKNAPAPGLRSEEEIFQIETEQIAAQKPANQLLARWAIEQANLLLARPESDIVADIKEQSGLNAAGDEVDSFARELSNTGLLNVLGGDELINQIEAQVDSQVAIVLPPKILLTRTALTDSQPTLEITNKNNRTFVGLPVTVIGRDTLGAYKASRVWLTIEAEPSGKSWKLKRWITRPI